MNNKLYVGNLPYTVDENALKEMFSSVGYVESAKIITDSFDGRSKGYGFVEMQSEAEANSAVEQLNGKEFGGRTIKVDIAKAKSGGFSRGPRREGGGGGNRGGGFGGGNGPRRDR